MHRNNLQNATDDGPAQLCYAPSTHEQLRHRSQYTQLPVSPRQPVDAVT